jgi:Domain of unknown function (DUF3846)
MATLIRAAGEIVEVSPASGASFALAELQAHVGGYVEAIRIRGGWILCNEDGIALGLPHNREATRRAGFALRGDVLICTSKEMK